MRYLALPSLLLALFAPSPAPAADPPKLELKDGDRIVYLGNTFVERDANYGYLETLLTARHPDIAFTFRNLGWSGDTVWGDARARFGTRADGFKHLKDHVLALRPTVILVAYGLNESFAGEAGLKEFESGLNTLLDTLAETKARIVLISPIPHEKLPAPLPDPAKHNVDLGLYRDAMARVAASRGCGFVDLIDDVGRMSAVGDRLAAEGKIHARRTLTADGLHPDDLGYFAVDGMLARDHENGGPDRWGAIRIEISKDGDLRGDKVVGSERTATGYRFEVLGDVLATVSSPGPDGRRAGGRPFTASGLPSGTYVLRIDGVPVDRLVVSGRHTTVLIRKGPEIDQVEKLRAAINKKNELYFHRWRPQNETYLFGFRKHEQGNNSVEIPQFDPLVAEQEAEIARLKKPVKHRYEIDREGTGTR